MVRPNNPATMAATSGTRAMASNMFG
jgi:hypothetical protein